MSSPTTPFANLDDIAAHLRKRLEEKKYVLLFAYNGNWKNTPIHGLQRCR